VRSCHGDNPLNYWAKPTFATVTNAELSPSKNQGNPINHWVVTVSPRKSPQRGGEKFRAEPGSVRERKWSVRAATVRERRSKSPCRHPFNPRHPCHPWGKAAGSALFFLLVNPRAFLWLTLPPSPSPNRLCLELKHPQIWEPKLHRFSPC